MNALRSVIFFIILGILTPPLALLIILSFPLPPRVRLHSVKPWVKSAIWLIDHVLGIRYRVVGKENIPPQACILLVKHQSAWETIVLQEIFRDTIFVFKKELHRLPFFGWALAATPMIAINRAAPREALRQLAAIGSQRLAEGFTVAIFPEGTRTNPGEHRRFKPGGAHLAVKSGALVVPVAQNSGEYWGVGVLDKRPGEITVSIGPAINPAGLSVAAINAQVEQWTESEMRRISPHLYLPPGGGK